MTNEFKNTIQSDENLVELIKQDDSNAFKALYFRYYDKLFRFAYFRIHSVEISKDLMQDLFSNVWQNRKNLKPDKSIKSYLYRSLANILINHSKLKSSQNISYSGNEENASSVEPQLDRKIDLHIAINKLPEKLKSVYLLSRLEGFKYAEIAEILNISVKTVEKRMSKVLKILRDYFS